MDFLDSYTDGYPLVVFEIANNHQGDVEHGVRTIQEYAKFQEQYGDRFRFAIKFQYRDLDTFIHPDFKGSDLKYTKRFEETRLQPANWKRLIQTVKDTGMLAMCTPFDEISVGRVVDDGFDILKVASCSLTDWPLFEEIAKYKMPVIVSVGGSSDDEISNVNAFFSHRNIDYALLFCVGLYPTDAKKLNIAMITELRHRYPYLTFGFSTHEHPDETTAVAVALGAGARIFEKHVALPTEKYKKNLYSVDIEECNAWLMSLAYAHEVYGSAEARTENLAEESKSLRPLMRGAFAKLPIEAGELLTTNNTFFAIPTDSGGLVANDFSRFRVIRTSRRIEQNQLIKHTDIEMSNTRAKIIEIRNRIRAMIVNSGVVIPKNIKLEISYHYGLEKFDKFGLCMLTVLNKQYCKKVLFLMPGQQHPEQYHKIKHETFLVLYGDVELKLDGVLQSHKFGDLISISPGVKHEFWSKSGAVIEEFSTESLPNDSFYTDVTINQIKKRKSYVELE